MWDDVEDYLKWCRPEALLVHNPSAACKVFLEATPLERITSLAKVQGAFDVSLVELSRHVKAPLEQRIPKKDLPDVYSLVIDVGGSGEELLLHLPGQRTDERVEAFRVAKDGIPLWQEDDDTKRRVRLNRLLPASEGLRDVVREYQSADWCRVDQSTSDLPDALLIHFRESRDLLSIGADDMAAFAALQGLEATLRRVVRWDRPEHPEGRSAGLSKLLQHASTLRYRDHSPVLEKQARSLLEHLRDVRNGIVHVRHVRGASVARDTINIAAKQAAALWVGSGNGRKKLFGKRMAAAPASQPQEV